jgi:hypothetical protein
MATPCLAPTVTTVEADAPLRHPKVNPETSVVLALFPSASKPGHAHAVARSHHTGDTWCTCPAFRFQRVAPADRVCKHIKRVAASSLAGVGPLDRHEAAIELAKAPKRQAAARAAYEAHRKAKQADK